MDVREWAIPEPECWELLARVSVGRVALSMRALPAILPVQYYLDGRTLAVCLGHQELLTSSLDKAVVAFAADAIDAASRSGWSVQVQGRSALAREPRFDIECGWPASGQVVQIEPVLISGVPGAPVSVHRRLAGRRRGTSSTMRFAGPSVPAWLPGVMWPVGRRECYVG